MEILAPCGSPRHLAPAVYCGADAVYLGLKNLSARAGAENFTKEELSRAVDFCHTNGVKVHLAVNTLVRDEELAELEETLRVAAEAGVDALIVQDWGVAALVKSHIPGMRLHASTQTSIHTPGGAALAHELGFSRLVLARELTEEQIAEIARAAPIELEAFVHGALCVSVSGQCYMSSVLGGRSGNRGRCAQPCRLEFSACGGKSERALSLKDLSLVDKLDKLRRAGVCSLKIEGRMKRPEYVAAAVSAVRAAMDGKEPDMESLRAVFSRSGFTQGYFSGNMENMGGAREKEDVAAASAVLPRLQRLYDKPRAHVPLDMRLEVRPGQPALLAATDGHVAVTVRGGTPEQAQTSPLDLELVKKRLEKLGGTQYVLGSLEGEISPGLSLSAAALNSLRREAVLKLDGARRDLNKKTYEFAGKIGPVKPSLNKNPNKAPELRLACQACSQWLAARDLAHMGRLPSAVALEHIEELRPDRERIIIEPPRFLAGAEGREYERLERLRGEGFCHLLCQNAGHMAVGRQLGFILHGGFGLNVTNSHAARALEEAGLASLTLSMELKLRQTIASPLPLGRVSYGRLPLMLLARCPRRSSVPAGGCADCGPLTDRMGKRFPLRCDGPSVELLNADVLWLADKAGDLRGLSFIELLLDKGDDAVKICKSYLEGAAPPPGFTRGLGYRGVE